MKIQFPERSISNCNILSISLPILTLLVLTMMTSTRNEINEREKLNELILQDQSFCAPINKFNFPYNPLTPMAPKLDVKWDHNYPITCASDEVQHFFNQGLFYMYAFNHAEAERSFKEGIRLDPDCAMCHWGAAMTLGPNINRPMPEAHIEEAYQLSRRALQLSARVSDKERKIIQSLSHRYSRNKDADRDKMNENYAESMRLLSHRYRDDLDLASLFAEALMTTMPWDYWKDNGEAKPKTKEVTAVLDYVLEKDPRHPGANHYYIHAVEALYPDDATHCADQLQQLEYQAGHLVHMPSHIYIRTGRYHEAAISNQRAALVDEKYIEECNIQGFYPALYYPHNLHFLWFAASMEGRSEVSIEAARKLKRKVPESMVSEVSRLQRFYAIPYFALVRFAKWEEILNEPAPDASFVYSKAIWHFAQGMAFANTGAEKKAKTELINLKKAIDSREIIDLDYARFPTLAMCNMAYFLLQGELAGIQNQGAKKVQLIEKAVVLQDGLIYMEPPFFYFPVRQALGAALLENKQVEEAEKVFMEELEMFPENGWSLFGLYRSLKEQGKEEKATAVYDQFKESWKYADVEIENAVIN